MFRLQANVSVSDVFMEITANAGMQDSSGIVKLSEKPGEKRKYCKVGRK